MSDPTDTSEVMKKPITIKKIITLLVLMASCYGVAFYAAHWVLGPDGPETVEAPVEKTLNVGSIKARRNTP